VRIFQSRWFQRFAWKEGITDAVLCDAIARAEKGQIDARLGGEVIKQRIARPGHGRSKGYRTIILFRHGAKAFFVYGFGKASGRTSMTMKRNSSSKPQNTSSR
jgi:hypothetical protein